MKRCPECRRDYYDDTLLYCLDDGNALLEGPGGMHLSEAPSIVSEPATVLIHSAASADAAPTQVLGINPPPIDINAIAVLPFTNMSRDKDVEYLSDGLAEELLNVLSRIQGLRVAGRMSAFSFKGKQATFEEIGRRLNVSLLLDGSVRIAGDRVRIAVQLVNVADGYHLWSETYDRPMDDIFAIQDDIASSVLEELRSRLTSKGTGSDPGRPMLTERQNATNGRAVDPEAHRLMLLGRHVAASQTPEATAKGVAYFEQALDIDPQNAACWLELAAAHIFRAGHGFIGYEEGYGSARIALHTALSLEPDFAAAHSLFARLKLSRDLDFRGADESIRLAFKLEPDNVSVLRFAASVVRGLGRVEESMEISRRLIRMDPLNSNGPQMFALSAYASGMLDEAETALREALEITPKGVSGHANLAVILAAKGSIDKGRAEAASESTEIWRLWATALVEVAGGNLNERNAALDRLIELASEDCAFQIAEVYSTMGENDEAFKYLEIAVRTDPGTSQILVSPELRPIRSDPRWQPLLRKIGIPEEYWT